MNYAVGPVYFAEVAVGVNDFAFRKHLLLHLIIGERDGNSTPVAVFAYASPRRHALFHDAHEAVFKDHLLHVWGNFRRIQFLLSGGAIDQQRSSYGCYRDYKRRK